MNPIKVGRTIRIVECAFEVHDKIVVELIHFYSGDTETFLVKEPFKNKVYTKNNKAKAIERYMEIVKREIERI